MKGAYEEDGERGWGEGRGGEGRGEAGRQVYGGVGWGGGATGDAEGDRGGGAVGVQKKRGNVWRKVKDESDWQTERAARGRKVGQ